MGSALEWGGGVNEKFRSLELSSYADSIYIQLYIIKTKKVQLCF